jgi:hypothetical protein
MLRALFISGIFLSALAVQGLRAQDDFDEDDFAGDTFRMDMSHQPSMVPFFPDRLDGNSRRLTERERNEQTEPLGEMRNWDEHPTPNNFDNRTLDLPFKEDRNDLPVITPKIKIKW